MNAQEMVEAVINAEDTEISFCKPLAKLHCQGSPFCSFKGGNVTSHGKGYCFAFCVVVGGYVCFSCLGLSFGCSVFCFFCFFVRDVVSLCCGWWLGICCRNGVRW